MAFVNNFLKNLTMPLGDLAKWLEEEHQVPVVDTIEKWNELTGMNVTIGDDEAFDCEDVVDQTIDLNKKELDANVCQHVFRTGNRKGQQCTIKPKGGSDRCSAHRKKDEKEDKPKKEKKEKKEKKGRKQAAKNLPSKEFLDSEDESDLKKEVPPKPVKSKKKKAPKNDSDADEPERQDSHAISDSDAEKEEEEEKKVHRTRKRTVKMPQPASDEE